MYDFKRKKLVESLKNDGRIFTKKVEDAFLNIPREQFIPENIKKYAYIDTPLEIGNGQTISAPHMVAIMCEALDIKQGQKILEIGTGSGYHAAIVSKIVGNKGHVYTIERFENLASQAKKNIIKVGIENVTVIIGDGSIGLKKYQPYDRIYITCAAPMIPQPLLEQLDDGGKLLIPVGNIYCSLELVEKKQEKLITTDLGSCVFVPLVGKYGYRNQSL